MKLIRFGNKGEEKPGILDTDGRRRDMSGYFRDWNAAFFENNGIQKIARLKNRLREFPLVAEDARWAPCIARPRKVVCIGLNYADHALESAQPIPSEPIVFLKAPNTVVGAFDEILIPRNSTKTDWEIELGIVIQKDARYLQSESEAASHIGGYTICNDVSERSFQLEMGGQWTKGKSCDNFNPIGPYMATSDEIDNVQNLEMKLTVNGVECQNGNTRNMIFNCQYLVYYLSQFMTLEAGDLISTGTPAGIAMAKTPQKYLDEGDQVELYIEGLGRQRQVCRKA